MIISDTTENKRFLKFYKKTYVKFQKCLKHLCLEKFRKRSLIILEKRTNSEIRKVSAKVNTNYETDLNKIWESVWKGFKLLKKS